MQLLIAHQESEIGLALAGMVRDYTAHTADFVASNEAALQWIDQYPECDLLITQLESEGVDGLTLATSLAEALPSLHTIFLPGYPLSAQRIDVANTKIFPEPIDGERLLHAIERTRRFARHPESFSSHRFAANVLPRRQERRHAPHRRIGSGGCLFAQRRAA